MKLLILIVVAACGGSSGGGAGQTQPTQPQLPEPQIQGTPAPPCKDALADVVAYSGQPLGDIMLKHCEADAWSPDVRACFTREPAAKPQPCIDMLSNHQRQQFGEDVQKTSPAE